MKRLEATFALFLACSLLLAGTCQANPYDAQGAELTAPSTQAEGLSPLSGAAVKAATKAYTLVGDFTQGRERGDLAPKTRACKFETREEADGAYHLELTKRGESRISARFEYKPSTGTGRVVLRCIHKATVANQCPIDVSINGRKVVSNWSPSETEWHITGWDVTEKLQSGVNDLELCLGNATKMYWLRRLEVAAPSDTLFPASGTGPGPGGDWVRLMGDAEKDFTDGRHFARTGDKDRARAAFRGCMRKCDRVVRNAPDGQLKQEARELTRRARYELNQVGPGTDPDDDVFKDAFRYFSGYSNGLQLDKDRSRQLAMQVSSYGRPGLDNFKKLYRYASGYSNGLQLSKDISIQFALDSCGEPDEYLENFKTAYRYGVGYSNGLQLSKDRAIELGKFLGRLGPSAVDRFKKLYRYAAGYSNGLQLGKDEAIAFARDAVGLGESFLEDFKAAYRYGVGYSNGLQLSKDRAIELAKQIAYYGPGALERFKKDYKYAVSYSGMQLPKEEAIQFALERLQGN